MNLLPMLTADLPEVLRLNAGSVRFLSALDRDRLAHLHAESSVASVIADGTGVRAFLLAFREGADYDSVNYQWFAARYPRFLYVDRVVVDAGTRGQGLATRLYEHTFATAAAFDVPLVACEIDSEPPNVASEHFHAKFGFREVGTQAVPYAPKVVSLRVADVGARPAPGRTPAPA